MQFLSTVNFIVRDNQTCGVVMRVNAIHNIVCILIVHYDNIFGRVAVISEIQISKLRTEYPPCWRFPIM